MKFLSIYQSHQPFILYPRTILVLLVCLFLLSSCQQETKPFDEYVFAVQLVDDEKKIKEYLDYHRKIWPEVEEGFNQAGYECIRLYRFGNYISMIVRVPKGADLQKMGNEAASSHPRVKEWNELMATYQRGLPGVKDGTTWVVMDKIYEFNPEN